MKEVRCLTGAVVLAAAVGLVPAAALPSGDAAEGAPAPASAPAPEMPERFRATLATTGGPGPMTSSTLYVTIERWSAPEERCVLQEALKTKGMPGLLEEMENHDLGYVEIGGSLGRRVRVANTFSTDKGRVVRVALDRPIAFAEVDRSARTLDYPVGVIEFTLPAGGGAGEGVLIAAARVGFDAEGTLLIESSPGSTGPQRLFGVKPEKPKKKKKPKD